MGNPNPKPKFAKGNKSATVNKGKHQRKTVLKEKMGLTNWDDAEKIVEKNIMELLQSKSKKDRMFATKNFAEFIKPKKREHTGDFKGNIVMKFNGLTKF